MSITNPCKGCKDRYLGCHSKCDKYDEFKIKIGEAKQAKQRIDAIVDYERKSAERKRKK